MTTKAMIDEHRELRRQSGHLRSPYGSTGPRREKRSTKTESRRDYFKKRKPKR